MACVEVFYDRPHGLRVMDDQERERFIDTFDEAFLGAP